MNKKLLLIDANALIHRAWHALPPLTTKNGEMVNALYGFLLMLLKVIPQQKPDSVIAAFDLKGPTFRHTLFTAYKAQRVKQADELYEQFPKVKEMLRALGVCVLEKEGFEADDIIGTISHQLTHTNPPTDVLILTGDMDTMQLVNDSVKVLCFKKGVSETVLYDEAAVEARYSLKPSQLVDYKALRGDPSDNIPGVKGIGEKTATQLLQQYGSIAGILKELKKKDCAIAKTIAAKLESPDTDLALNQKLVTIDLTVPLKYSMDACVWGQMDRPRVLELLHKYEFESLAKRLPSDEPVGHQEKKLTPKSPTAKLSLEWKELQNASEIDEFVKIVQEEKTVIASAVEASGLLLSSATRHAYISATLLGASAKALHPLTSEGIGWIGHDLKEVCRTLLDAHIESIHPAMDTMVASYLLNPGSRAHTLANLAFTELKRDVQSMAQGQQQLLAQPSDAIRAMVERNDIIRALVPIFQKKLGDDTLTHLFETIELPLIPVLARMERFGVKVDTDYLAGLHKTLSKKIQRLETDITKLAGEPFNLNSPLQLQHILFERLQLPTKGISKTKTGLSTAADELEKLAGEHPIIPKLSEYRELTKLLNTYVTALPLLVDKKTGRIHTTYNQTVAATGRLSSTDPNLQNIPIRTELGNEVRNAFVAERGSRLLSLDYNQIELRVVASLAQDKKMLASFQSGEDIHARTAAEVFSIPIEQVTPDQRRTAKTVNFGVLYGLGSTGLAQTTGLTRAQAKEFIERYFQIYSGVKTFMDKSKQQAQEYGFVETLFGRKRHLPDITSTMPQVRAAAERMAANMPVQGTAADILKLAMIKIDAELSSWSKNARMLLQVHDELVFEVDEDEVEAIAQKAATVMETVLTLDAPIIVSAKSGTRWGSMESLKL